ncbi:pyridoxamine 5-phosphate oxidase [Lutimaribacter sp. EGI FJ00015]|uniref:Pyridoxamine 5-phosphate oxidase n=2 Tax=Lutimaribacter degradans TaxID=2945989 RepID=A0ACC5ZXJ9_9RHOB|nr:pyridoxamine 5-phosphate oxidase [Lutimaribacter sp. EGI FJ00013]MCM2562900.1 pyridoxamine 5-phosphate oxidase [Lutimaribacter sp. EGI FJ00013]MCO0614067.1 pyridoxamine 5-phosphate oxidase [Lutimaribacter sp. EGI FJ00015]MCO0636045.1 pyridoxamine 5-phosphate oxidase [Lutimaribacter sp. EGI FJ00014]
MPTQDPFQPADDNARQIAHDLLGGATHAALAVIRPGSPLPSVSRIAMTTAPDGAPLSLISSLAPHSAALLATPDCALLLGDPGEKGDPLTYPRLTIHARATLIARDDADHAGLRSHYLARRPKSKLYIDFADFRLVRFTVTDGLLNGGFGKAYILSAADLIDGSPAPETMPKDGA